MRPVSCACDPLAHRCHRCVLFCCIFLCACGPQGFQWYANELRRDSDGDVACSFLEESPELSRQSSSEHHSQAAASAMPEASTAQKRAGTESLSSDQADRKVGGALRPRQPLSEVPLLSLQPMGPCPIVCCIDGNLAHSLGPTQQVGFA